MEFQKLQSEMIAAMKAHDKERKAAIADLVSAAKKIAIDEGKRDDIPEEVVDRAIVKEMKTVKEEIDTCPPEREDLKKQYQFRYDVMAEFAPKQMDHDELVKVISEKFPEQLASKNKGQVMKAVMGELRGKADGKLINQVVSELLAQ